ncbi:MAG TPA: RNA polymerase factor sigma-32 [Azospirillum sp.]|nr:RNA polymerase factor sigma-32 [Azospirillum sp.]
MPGPFRSDEPLTLYLKDIGRFQRLGLEEEQALARRWRDQRDPAALDRLVGSHLPLALKIAKTFRSYGLPLSDLTAEGNVGLLLAARKFDPDKGFRFATYASWWVRATIQEYVHRNWSLVKAGSTSAHRRLFFRLRAMRARLRQVDGGDVSPETAATIAAETGVSATDVLEMNRRLAADVSLNTPVSPDGDGEWQDLLADERPNQEAALAEAEERRQRERLIKLGLETLTERDRQILIARRLLDEPVPTEELGRRLNLTRQRIGQIEAKALETVRKSVIAGRNGRGARH